MEIISSILLLGLGLFFLIYSSTWLIQGSVKLAFLLKLTPLFIGIVFVGFGTSTPELGVSIMSVLRNQKDLALGTVIGSNIANIGLIMGLCALIRPMKVERSIFRRELIFMTLAAVLLYVVSLDLVISRGDGVIFIGAFILFLLVSYKGAKNVSKEVNQEISAFKLKKVLVNQGKLVSVVIAVLSVLGIVYSADLMVKGGVALSKIFNVPAWVVAITIFALGTSLPELATSLSATFKKVHSVSVGNIVGSNIFNVLFILGIVALIKPISLQPRLLTFELPALLFFTILLYTVMRTAYIITRWEGMILLSGYGGFLYLLLTRTL